jgi:hypothetical protein
MPLGRTAGDTVRAFGVEAVVVAELERALDVR